MRACARVGYSNNCWPSFIEPAQRAKEPAKAVVMNGHDDEPELWHAYNLHAPLLSVLKIPSATSVSSQPALNTKSVADITAVP